MQRAVNKLPGNCEKWRGLHHKPRVRAPSFLAKQKTSEKFEFPHIQLNK